MDFTTLNPWNWFTKEEEHEKNSSSAQNNTPQVPGSMNQSSVSRLHSEIDRLFNETFHNFGFGSSLLRPFKEEWGGKGACKPKMDITGSEQEYTISAELPGVDEKDIQVELKGDTLIIKAEKEKEAKSEEKGYYHVERSYGSFQRILKIPADADSSAIKAEYKNGVVTIKLPRKRATETVGRKIPLE